MNTNRQRNFFSGSLPVELAENLESLNPHWTGQPGPRVPPFHRWAFGRLYRLLTRGLTPATVLRGPRRVGKTVLFLDGALLIRLVQPLELRLKRKKSAPKVCLSDLSLRASWLQEIVPLHPEGLAVAPHLADLAGHLAESILGSFLSSIPGLDLAHFPARGAEPEVDFVLTSGTRRIPVEVKYRRRIDPHEDTRGLRAFLEKTVYNAPFGLLVTLEDKAPVLDPRIIPVS